MSDDDGSDDDCDDDCDDGEKVQECKFPAANWPPDALFPPLRLHHHHHHHHHEDFDKLSQVYFAVNRSV